MLLVFLLFFAIFLASLAGVWWLADTTLARSPLVYIYSVVISSVFVSLAYFGSLIVGISYWYFIGLSIFAGTGSIYYHYRQQERSFAQMVRNIFNIRISIYLVCVPALLWYLSYLFTLDSGRWGRWDARAIWSLHALFLTDPDHWREMFSDSIKWTHADYPLMLSSFIAMFWRAMGMSNALVPCITAYAIFIAVLVVIYTGLKQKGNSFIGLLGLLVFALTKSYAKIAAFQGADTLLSLFILMAFVLARKNNELKNLKLFFLTGLIVGFAGWVKNEGIAFIAVFSVGVLWANRKERRCIINYVGGLLLPVTVIVLYKIFYAPANDIISGQNHDTISRLLDVNRYILTGKVFVQEILHVYPGLLAVLLLIMISGYRKLWDQQLALIGIMLAVYFFTFIITPRDLSWHLETASERLFVQLFPALVYVLLMLLSDKYAAQPTIHS